MGEEDEPMLALGVLIGVALTLGAVAIHNAHQGQWHVRVLRQIRALPERRPPSRQETP